MSKNGDDLEKHRSRASRPTLRNLRIIQQLKELNFDPIAEMVNLYNHHESDNSLRLSIAKELATYYAPKIKSVEVAKLDSSGGIKVSKKTYTDPDKRGSKSPVTPVTPVTPVGPKLIMEEDVGDRSSIQLGPKTLPN